MNEWLFIWLGVIVVTLIIEIISVGLTSIWLTGGALVALLVCLVGLPWPVQVALFFIVTFVLIYFTRPWAMKYLESKKTLTNYEEAIGKEVRIIEAIDNRMSQGKAMYNGIEWTARAEKDDDRFEVDEQAKVVAISGVKLIVRKITIE